MEDQTIEVVGQIGEGQFGLDICQPDGPDEKPNRIFCWANTCSTRAQTADFLALARAVAWGIGLPAGFRRWIRLVIIRSASHCERVTGYSGTGDQIRLDRATGSARKRGLPFGDRRTVRAQVPRQPMCLRSRPGVPQPDP